MSMLMRHALLQTHYKAHYKPLCEEMGPTRLSPQTSPRRASKFNNMVSTTQGKSMISTTKGKSRPECTRQARMQRVLTKGGAGRAVQDTQVACGNALGQQ
jgi:hypothetical protein